jgi:hypothetical protein
MKMSGVYHESIEREFNVEINILIAKRQIEITGKQEDIIKCEKIIKDGWSAMPKEKQIATTTITECPICYNPTNYSLQACGHSYCLDCLRQQLSTKFDTTLSNESLKVKCMMPQCDLMLLLRDIKTIIHPTNMARLARASLQAFLRTDNDSDIVPCIGIDCNQVRLIFCEKENWKLVVSLNLGLSEI